MENIQDYIRRVDLSQFLVIFSFDTELYFEDNVIIVHPGLNIMPTDSKPIDYKTEAKVDKILEESSKQATTQNDKTFIVAIIIFVLIAIIGAFLYYAVGYLASTLGNAN